MLFRMVFSAAHVFFHCIFDSYGQLKFSIATICMMKMFLITTFTLLFLSSSASAQSVVDELGVGGSSAQMIRPDMATETIKRISGSKRIFIITNNGSTFNKGDFVTIVRADKRAARAVVAKNENGIAGLKILKIYSLAQWNTLNSGQDIQVLRGDDSFFNVREAAITTDQGPTIRDETNLFDETTVLEDEGFALQEEGKRVLKNDNIVSFSLGLIDANGGRETQPNGAWAYQVEDNIWLEANYGQNIIKGYPDDDIDTKLTNFTLRAKYAIAAPLDSYLLPYIGYQIVGASSPSAGENDELGSRTAEELQAELDDVDALKKSQLVFGATWLKRLVPGWFIRVDLGADIIAGGASLEF